MKTIITIEREDIEFEGVSYVKRVVKENNIILHESTVTLEEINKYPSGMNNFDRWIKSIKNPRQIRTGISSIKKSQAYYDNIPELFL